MTKTTMSLADLLEKQNQGDFLRAVAEAVFQLIMESDVEGVIGAGRHERTDGRTTWRNGYRDRSLDTRLGTLNLRVPKLRQGSCFPGFLEPRRTSEKALVAVIQEAWVGGVSTRRVDELVQAMGLTGISKSTVSKLCEDIDERVGEFLNRPLTGDWPYLWLDATYLKVRQGWRIVSVAAIIAVAVNTDGRRESVPLMRHWFEHNGERPGHGPFGSRDLLGGLPARPEGAWAGWREARHQRCAYGPPPDGLPRSAHRRELPREHWAQIASTNPLERVNREIERRADAIGIFQSDGAITRPVGAPMLETNREWTVARRHMSLETRARVTDNPTVRLPAVAP